MKITIPSLDLRNERIIKLHDFFLDLREDRLIFKFVAATEKPIVDDDPESGWKPVDEYSLVIAKRDMLIGIELYLIKKPEAYGVYIYINGMADIIKFYYEKKEDAISTLKQIEDWMFYKETNGKRN